MSDPLVQRVFEFPRANAALDALVRGFGSVLRANNEPIPSDLRELLLDPQRFWRWFDCLSDEAREGLQVFARDDIRLPGEPIA